MPNHIAYKLPINALDVVVIDDNQSMRQILHSILVAFGVRRVRHFPDGESALREMADYPPNLVITDWLMKPLTGYQVLRAMRSESSGSLCLVPVIMLTAYASRNCVQKSFDAGVQQFLIKPVSPHALFKRIKWILKDDRELILKDWFYTYTEDLGGPDEKTIRTKARARILQAQIHALQNRVPRVADAEEPVHQPAKEAQAGDGHAELWKI